jgi:hypothetical protein
MICSNIAKVGVKHQSINVTNIYDSLAVIQDFIKEQQEEDSDEKTDSKVVNIDSDSDSTKKTNENDLSQSGDERTEKSNSVKSLNQVNVCYID